MKVYIVNVNNCEAYSDYYEGNEGVYATREAALADMEAKGYDMESHRRIEPWDGWEDDPDWKECGMYSESAFRIEEWEVQGV